MGRLVSWVVRTVVLVLLSTHTSPAVAASEYVRDSFVYPSHNQQQVDDHYSEAISPSSFDLQYLAVRWLKTSDSSLTIRYVTKGLIDSSTYKLMSSAHIRLDTNLDGIEDYWIPIGDDLWDSVLLEGFSKTNVYSTSSNSSKCLVTQQLSPVTFRTVDVTIPLTCLNFGEQVGVRVTTNFGYGTGGFDVVPNYSGLSPEFAVFDTPLAPEKTTYLPSAVRIDLDIPEQALHTSRTEFTVRVTNIAGEPLSGVHLTLDSNGALWPRSLVTGKDGTARGTVTPLFDGNVFVSASYGTASVTGNLRAVNYTTDLFAEEYPESQTSLCFTYGWDYSLLEKFGITGTRWKVERNKSGRWEKVEFELPIPSRFEPTSLSRVSEFGSYGNVLTDDFQGLVFEPNGVVAGETIKCSVALLVGEQANLYTHAEFTATVNGKYVAPKPAYSVYQRTLAAFGRDSTGLTPQQKAQVKSAVEATPNAEKFICTGIRYFDQPMSMNIMVRKRAKAACDYAKALNPNLSTWFQNKPTQAQSFAGKVLLTVKSPSD